MQDAEPDLDGPLIERIENSDAFYALVRRRRRLAWIMAAVILVLYSGFILLVAFAPDLLGRPIAEGQVTTIGIPLGLLLIIASIALTGIYVRRANTVYDAAMRRLIEDLS